MDYHWTRKSNAWIVIVNRSFKVSTTVIALIAASLGAVIGFMCCAVLVSGKIADLEQKVFDLERDGS